MNDSNASVRNADLCSIHKYPWKWYLDDLEKVHKNGKKVFSCFSCGGGSSMGYKLAGYDVIGNVEIDPRMMEVYRENHHPRHSYLMDIRDFLRIPQEELPAELFDLDILDGSPPCSVFSVAGIREKAWGKEKRFREGQKCQTIDDLFFHFIEVVNRLQPKVVVAENVKGIIIGRAKGYVNEILKHFDSAGYAVQIFLLNAMYMGVPQKRERVFFIARRKDLQLPKLILNIHEPPILFGEVRTDSGRKIEGSGRVREILSHMKKTDKSVKDILLRVEGKRANFNEVIFQDYFVAGTLTATGMAIRGCDKTNCSDGDCRNISTFPQDFDFGKERAKYICGMSVPPVMMAHIASDIYEQWLK